MSSHLTLASLTLFHHTPPAQLILSSTLTPSQPAPPALLPQVKLFSVQHLFEVWADFNAALTSLRQLPGSGGLVLAEFADSSVRLLNTGSSEVRQAGGRALSSYHYRKKETRQHGR